MGFVLHWLVYSLPWWMKLAGVAVVLGAAAAVFPLARKHWREMLAGGAILAAGIWFNRAQQQGYNQRVDDEKRAETAAKETVETERNKAAAATDAELQAEVDRWTRG